MIAGTALGVMNAAGGVGALTGLFGNNGNCCNNNNNCGCNNGNVATAEATGMMAGMAIANGPWNWGWGRGWNGGWNGNAGAGWSNGGNCCINEDHCVNRYEFNRETDYQRTISQKDLDLARKDSELALCRAKENTREEIISLYEQIKREDKDRNAFVDSQLDNIHRQLAAQAIQNQANKDSFQLLQERMDTKVGELACCIQREADTRKCNDNLLVTYMNATFYPKQVADVTVGSATTPQTLYNPLPACECCNSPCPVQ